MTTATERKIKFVVGGWSGASVGETMLEAITGATGGSRMPAGNYLWDGRSGVICGYLVGVADGRDTEEVERDAMALVPVTVIDGESCQFPDNAGEHFLSGDALLARMAKDGLA